MNIKNFCNFLIIIRKCDTYNSIYFLVTANQPLRRKEKAYESINRRRQSRETRADYPHSRKESHGL